MEKDLAQGPYEPSLGGLLFAHSHLAAPDCQGAGAGPSMAVSEEVSAPGGQRPACATAGGSGVPTQGLSHRLHLQGF